MNINEATLSAHTRDLMVLLFVIVSHILNFKKHLQKALM